MSNKKEVKNVLVFFVILILTIQFVSAEFTDFFDNFKSFLGEITGLAISDTTTPTVTVASVTPTIKAADVEPPATQTITLKGLINVSFYFNATDQDGAGDLNFSTAQGYINMTGETDRYNFSCHNITNVNASTQRFNCTVAVWWYDGAGDWTVNVSIKDNSSNYVEETSKTFSIDSTKGMEMGPGSLSWSSVNLGDTDTLATENITINNTGNVNIAEVNVTGFNLHGTTTSTQYIYAANFSVNINNACNSGDNLGNYTNVTVTSASVNKGDFTANDGTAQEHVVFCLEAIEGGGGSLSVQTYQTLGSWPWEVFVR